VHDTKALTIDPDAVRAWLCQPSDEHPEFTHAESLGVDEELTGPGEEGFLPTVDDVLAAEPDGVHRRADVSRVELWLIPDGEILHQGAVITVDLANGIRLASLHQDVKDFADRDQRGASAILAALDHIATQVCLLVDRYHTHTEDQAHMENQAHTEDQARGSAGIPATAPSTGPVPVMFTHDAIRSAVNQAADDILDAVDAVDTGLRDGFNLLVNAALAYLTGEADDLTEVVAQGYEATYDEVLSWIEEVA
jgi:hypothetical protein